MPVSTSAAHKTDAVLRDVVRLFIQAQRRMTACCTAATAKECEALMLLVQHDGMTVQEFAERMSLEKTWASRLVARLEEAGLVRRSPNPQDGRSVLIELSAKGKAEQHKLADGLNEHATQLLQCVPAAERANVERALVHLRDALATCLVRCAPPGGRCG